MKDQFLSRQELEDEYPLMVKVFGLDAVRIERITEYGKSQAHMLFAPSIEKQLKSMAQEKLWSAFTFEVAVKRRPSKPVNVCRCECHKFKDTMVHFGPLCCPRGVMGK